MSKFFRLFTCSSHSKSHKQKYKEKTILMPSLALKGTQETDSDSPPIVELYSYIEGGVGVGKIDCQDTFCIEHKLTPNSSFFGVYDGHGPRGREVSLFVNEQIAKIVKKEAYKLEKIITKGKADHFFKTTFKNVEKKLIQASIGSQSSGTCCICVLIYKSKCIVVNLGDSRAVLCRKRPTGDVQAINLSEDHKPSRADEYDRIIRNGGIIEAAYFEGSPIGPLRVWTPQKDAGIAMTRSMGDDYGRIAGIISEPEIREFDLQPTDQFIIVASDGLWDVMISEEAVEFVASRLKKGMHKNLIARDLTIEAKRRWKDFDDEDAELYIDDITVVIAYYGFHDDTHK